MSHPQEDPQEPSQEDLQLPPLFPPQLGWGTASAAIL